MSHLWQRARHIAYEAGRAAASTVPPVGVSVASLAGSLPGPVLTGPVLAAPVRALAAIPAFDTCSMDGWAVCGPGPWQVLGESLAGQREISQLPPLQPGQACVVATGSAVPAGTEGLLRFEDGNVKGVLLRADSPSRLNLRDVRPAGSEAAAGEVLAAAGDRITPPLLGLAAAAGHDCLSVVPRPVADVLVIGDELLSAGLPGRGRVRDSLGVQLPAWIRAGAGVPGPVRQLQDDAPGLSAAIAGSAAGVLVTTGGSSRGQGDHVRPVLLGLGATILVDGVQLRPGGPMKLAQLPDGRLVVALPGNPLAALAGVVTLLWPVLAGLGGGQAPGTATAATAESFEGHPQLTSLVPVTASGPGSGPGSVPGSTPASIPASLGVRACGHQGASMLRGIAVARALAVVPPGGLSAGDPIETIPLPW